MLRAHLAEVLLRGSRAVTVKGTISCREEVAVALILQLPRIKVQTLETLGQYNRSEEFHESIS